MICSGMHMINLNRKDGELKQLDAQIAEYERVLAELKQRKDQVEHE